MAENGWGWPTSSRKAHYFKEARSLCGRWLQVAPFGGGVVPIEAGADAAPSPSDCAPCTRKLAKLTPEPSEQPPEEVTE